MKLRILVVAVAVLVAQTALAKDMSGKMGIGAEKALGFKEPPFSSGSFDSQSNVPGFSFIYPASELFHVQVLGALNLALGGGTPAGPTIMLGATFRGLYHGIPLAENVDLVIIFGLGYVFFTSNDFAPQTTHSVHVETGLRPEWFVTDFISIHTQAGATVSLLLGQNNAAGFDPGVNIDAFANIDLVQQFGFTIWFE